ncbi:hypothetical protein [Anaeromicropila populeti]|uniref:Uncharacterized protein n=1 Tax=Anaeromicropila populeti TaxID=37658 RepID=A0A1I6IM01_9FIRM|nr:hypothetical protein [Anaeromicropila populeti]SFR67714.1 hypothetical protein SAMN05661086_00885 [Anaeromicropila populeti]
MKKQRKIILVLMLVVVTALTGCKGKSDSGFSIGTWNENVFENTWLDMKFEIQDDWNIATDEEIAEVIGAGAETMSELKGNSSEAMKAAAELKTVYGFMAADAENMINAQLVYENLALSIGGTKYTEEEYLDTLEDSLLQVESIGYEVVDRTTEELAGKTFHCLKLSGYDGGMYQEYYTYKMDKYMVAVIISYTPDKEDIRDEFVNSIATLA